MRANEAFLSLSKYLKSADVKDRKARKMEMSNQNVERSRQQQAASCSRGGTATSNMETGEMNYFDNPYPKNTWAWWYREQAIDYIVNDIGAGFDDAGNRVQKGPYSDPHDAWVAAGRPR